MTYKRLIITLLAVLLLVAGCVRTSPTTTSSPTSTPTHLTPINKLNLFVGGHGWASDLNQSVYYNTRNFGEHWLVVTPPGLSSSNSGWGTTAAFPSGDIGWVCQTKNDSSATLYISTDGGREWQIQNLNFTCGQISAINETEGYILSDLGVGAGSQYVSIHHTSDGGTSWDLRFEHEPANPDDHGLPTGGTKSYFGFLSSDIGLVAGYVPIPGSVYLFRSGDGGTSWIQSECSGLPVDDEQEAGVDRVIRVNSTTAILPVRSYLADGTSVTYFCSTTDAAETWQYVGKLEGVEFYDFGSLLTGVAYGQGKMFQTEDGGKTWTETTVGLPPAVTPISVQMINDRVGFLTATVTPETLLDNRLYMTGNNGGDWQPLLANIVE